MKSLIAVEGFHLGQIGAGKVVEFLPRKTKRWIPLPKGARTFDQFAEYEVCGDSLEGIGINDGDLLTCRRKFEMREIKPGKVCVVHIHHLNDQTAKMVTVNGDGTITLSGANENYKPQTYFFDEVEILAIAVEVRKQI